MASSQTSIMFVPGRAAASADVFWYSDASTPNVARIYDVLLGGTANLAADQAFAGELLRLVPDAVMAAYQNRNFVRRAVQFLAGPAGIRQFIDVGTGLPTQCNVHEIAQRITPDAHVLYVDHDPMVISRARELLAGSASAAAVNHDLRDPGGIIHHPALTTLIDLDKPVAILLASVLHFIDDAENPHAIVRVLQETMAPGSYLAVSHATGDWLPPEVTRRVRELYRIAAASFAPRTHEQIAGFLDGLELIPPGLVNGSAWRAGSMAVEPRRTLFYAGLGRKR